MTTYILQKGDYHRNRNILVTSDVKKFAKKYVDMIQKGAFGDACDNPYIEIWNEADEDYPTASSHEKEKNESRLIKYLSKLVREINV